MGFIMLSMYMMIAGTFELKTSSSHTSHALTPGIRIAQDGVYRGMVAIP